MERDQEGIVTPIGADQVSGELAIIAADAADAADAGKVSITDNKNAGAYELEVDGQAAAGLLYKETGTRVTLLATSVFPEFRGKGIAGRFLGEVLDIFRAEGRTVTLTCPFAAAFVNSHPEYADVVDPVFPGNAHSRGHGPAH